MNHHSECLLNNCFIRLFIIFVFNRQYKNEERLDMVAQLVQNSILIFRGVFIFNEKFAFGDIFLFRDNFTFREIFIFRYIFIFRDPLIFTEMVAFGDFFMLIDFYIHLYSHTQTKKILIKRFFMKAFTKFEKMSWIKEITR